MTTEPHWSRRRFLACAAAAGGALLAPRPLLSLSLGPAPLSVLRVGLLVPAGGSPAARSASDGVRLGVDEAARTAALFGRGVEMVSTPSTSADPAAQARALVDAGAHVLLSALADDATASASQVADERRVPLLNLTATGDALRGAGCRRFLFHVAPSDAMRADAAVRWLAAERKPRSAVVVIDGSPAHAATAERVEGALRGHGVSIAPRVVTRAADGTVGASAPVAADAVVLLVDSGAASGLAGGFTGTLLDLSDAASAVESRNGGGEVVRPAGWHAALERFGADQLNQRFARRFGRAMDDGAWAGWFAVKAAADGAMRSSAADAAGLAAYLAGGRAEVDGQKGWPLSFRPWDHQLRQPLYLVSTGGSGGGARVAGEVPAGERGADSASALDVLGTGAADGGCRPGER